MALGRAIVREPQVFLFDEPLSNLDAKLRVQTRTRSGRSTSASGHNFIYVTHDQVEAMTMGDPHRGVSAPATCSRSTRRRQVYDRPANLFVAGFIGSPPMNLVAPIESADNGLAVRLGDARIPIPATMAAERRLDAWVGKPF